MKINEERMICSGHPALVEAATEIMIEFYMKIPTVHNI